MTLANKGLPRSMKDLYERVEALEAGPAPQTATQTPITPITGVTGDNVQAALADLKAQIDLKEPLDNVEP